jgi:hypothetical protein
MLALMPDLCACGTDKRFEDSKCNLGFEPFHDIGSGPS